MLARLLPLLLSVPLFLSSLLLFAAPSAAQYVPADVLPTVGEAVAVQLPAGAEALVITSRPGSAIADTTRLTASAGTATWTPEQAGIVEISAPGTPDRQTVSVRFDRAPASGILVLLVAGTILFGGAAFASVKLFGKEPDEVVTDRPDT